MARPGDSSQGTGRLATQRSKAPRSGSWLRAAPMWRWGRQRREPLLITIGAAERSEEPQPWYSRWWVWTSIGVGAATAAIVIGVAYAAATLAEEPGPPATLGDHDV